jgi:hypothetical protein
MVNIPKIALELVLILSVFLVFKKEHVPINMKFVWMFTGITILLNISFYYLAAFSLYQDYGQSVGQSDTQIHLLIWFDILKWGIMAFVFVRYAVALQESNIISSFPILSVPRPALLNVVIWGVGGGIMVTIVAYGLTAIAVQIGIFEGSPWPFFASSDTYKALGLWGGVRNLFGEEILSRLGVQLLVMYLLRKHRFQVLLAIVISSLFFEFWHNGFKELYFLNFSASVVFATAYYYKGYEAAAISHCTADWLIIVLIPRLFF